MSAPFEPEGKVAVVTGAASGIGRAVARSLSNRGCHVALVDLNADGLEETARLIGNSVRVSRHCLDVVDSAAVAALPAEVLEIHGQADMLVNNAGVALSGNFDQLSEQDFDWLVEINFTGLVRLTRAFLSVLKARPQAQLVNMSSLFGLIAPPGQSAYSAAKFAVRGFSEALRNELRAEGSSVGVTVVHPGGVKTAIADNAREGEKVSVEESTHQRARFRKALRMAPEEAGEIIVKAILQRRPRVLVGRDAKIAALIERLMPVRYWRVIGKISR